MASSVEISRLIRAIEKLPEDKPHGDPTLWYKTQKEHWLGWLAEYHTRGAYKRATTKRTNAEYAYNHIVNYKMLLWLVEAAGVDQHLVKAARRASERLAHPAQKAASIRAVVPWSTLSAALWPRSDAS